MERRFDENVVFHWDWAWKTFLDPEAPWFQWIIHHLFDGKYDNYITSTEKPVELNREQRQLSGNRAADCFLYMVVDNQEKIIHLEFESANKTDPAKRLLLYGLTCAGKGQTIGNHECYSLPDTYLVYVRDTSGRTHRERYLDLTLHGHLCSLVYPVVQGHKALKYVDAIIMAETFEQLRGAVSAWKTELPDFSNSEDWSWQFNLACSLLNCEVAYQDEGVCGQEANEIMGRAQWDQTPAKIVWKREGIQEGIQEGLKLAAQQLSRTLNITVPEAEKMIQAGAEQPVEKTSNLGRMKL